MNKKDKIFIMQQITNIKIAMEKFGKTTSFTRDNNGFLFHIKFIDENLNVANNEIIYSSIEKIKEKFEVNNIIIGSGVSALIGNRLVEK